MNHKELTKLISNRFKKTTKQMAIKQKEYAETYDVLHNFKSAASLALETPEQALWGMLLKHIISVQDTIKKNKPMTNEWIDEKIGDCINYFILLEAILNDKI